MQELSLIAKNLWHLLKDRKNFFVTWSPDLSDFRTNRQIILKLFGKGETLEIPIPPRQHFQSFVGMLGQSIFGQDRVVIGWDIKQLFSYLKHNLPSHWQIPIYSELIDLKLCENYAGIQKDCPYTYEEATRRTSLILNNAALCKVNQQIFRPLAAQVIPALETIGITNKTLSQRQHPHYIIEGQVNGRLNTKVIGEGFFNPLNMDGKHKSEFSAGHEKKFIVFDYKHMEVSVLEWLSKDERLSEIIQSGEDIYNAIYRIVSGSKKCSSINRKWIKGIFLPVIYGRGASALAEQLNVSVKGAEALIDSIYQNFRTATAWVQDKQDQAKQHGQIKDVFGRILYFDEKFHKARNASVQSPAALICLDKLIQLYQQRYPTMDIIASVHDAYVCTVSAASWDSIAINAKELLETPSQFAIDCALKVELKVGDDWGDLSVVNM